MKALAIAGANLKRLIRERSNIFFVFIFPIALILLIGAQFGGGVLPVVGVTIAEGGRISEAVVDRLDVEESIETRLYGDRDELTRAVERGYVNAGVFLPAGMDETAATGAEVEIAFMVRPDGFGAQLQSVIGAAVAEVMKPVGAAGYAADQTGQSFDDALVGAQSAAEDDPGVGVAVSTVGEALFPDTLGRFDLGASQQLVLFIFVTALSGSAALILTRQLGISRRMLSTPTSVGSILLGESLGRFGTGLVQGLYIMVVTLVAFGVNWGDPLGAALVLVAVCAVGSGAAMLMGSVFRNEQQAGGVAVVLSLALAALGGAMVPIELFSPTLQRVALITPHAWAIDAFAELVRRGGTVVDILPQIGVLTLYAAVLLALATWRLRVAITRSPG
ncbi:MAG: ABC transporter permease [Actinobacteria bacterium]|nr:ABC transporter permease [Actinomycetota bacterium]